MTTASATISPLSVRPASEPIRSMPAALRSEWIKVTSLRSYAVIAVMTSGISAIATWAIARFVVEEGFTTANLYSFTTVFTAAFAAVAGILMFSSEAQHGTLAGTLAAQPSKTVITAAKAIAAATYGGFLAVIAMAAAVAGSQVGGVPFGDAAAMPREAALAVLYTAIASVFGLGIGMIARHSAAAISCLLTWWLLGETLITSFAHVRYSRLLPFNAGNALIGVTNDPDTATDVVLTATEGGLIFGGYALVALAIGTFILRRFETN